MRGNIAVDVLVRDLQTQIRELKEIQFFGSDSLKLKRFTKKLEMPANDLDGRLFKVIMRNRKVGATMPFSAQIAPFSADLRNNADAVLDFSKDGDDFIFYATLQPNYDISPKYCKITVIYYGKADFEIQEIN